MLGADVSLAWLLVAVLLASAISVLILWAIIGFRRVTPSVSDQNPASKTVFLLKDNKIIDQENGDSGQLGLSTWSDLRSWLGDRFGDLPSELSGRVDAKTQDYHAKAADDDAVLTIRHTPSGQSVILDDSTKLSASDRHVLMVKHKKDLSFQQVLEHAPAVVFGLSHKGALDWGNARFDRLTFEDRRAFLTAAQDRGRETTLQLCLDDPMSSAKQHFELSVISGEDGVVIYANDVTRLVEADSVRNAFIQTLTKTFADLSTGLAVFDKDQRLVLFNPAVLDLTDLSAEFLSARPEMIEFFDRLRDNHMMPEPKSYSTWRGQIGDMIKSASDGHYSENWSLPGGLTYKLTGRPHPNGAIAFLFEDITDEMTLTRQSRSQLETHQAILDAMQDAIAVMGPDGGLLISNAAFAEVVGFDPDTSFSRTSFKHVLDACEQRFPGSRVWDDLREGGLTRPMAAQLPDGAGGRVHFRAEPLSDGLFILNLSLPMPQVPLSA